MKAVEQAVTEVKEVKQETKELEQESKGVEQTVAEVKKAEQTVTEVKEVEQTVTETKEAEHETKGLAPTARAAIEAIEAKVKHEVEPKGTEVKEVTPAAKEVEQVIEKTEPQATEVKEVTPGPKEQVIEKVEPPAPEVEKVMPGAKEAGQGGKEGEIDVVDAKAANHHDQQDVGQEGKGAREEHSGASAESKNESGRNNDTLCCGAEGLVHPMPERSSQENVRCGRSIFGDFWRRLFHR